MTEYRYGDYVVYDPGYKEPEIGRVTRQGAYGNWFVCYHEGCTAACTPADMLRPATKREVLGASPRIGYHRFDAECPDCDEMACGMCMHAGKDRR